MRQRSGLILAVDPGLDRVAVAAYDPARCGSVRGSLSRAAAGFLWFEQLQTRPGDPVLVRCAEISKWLVHLVIRHEVELVVVETPAKDGIYHDKKGRWQQTKGSPVARGEALLNRAIGAIAAAAANAGAEVTELSSATYPREARDKKDRHRIMNAAFRQAGLAELKANGDVRDAAFVGMFYLATELT